MLEKVIYWIAKVYHCAVAMGNTDPPIVTERQVVKYREEIMYKAFKRGFPNFKPIMSVMLTYSMTPEILESAYQAGAMVLKLIPGGASTGSAQGVALWNLCDFYPVLRKAMELGMIFSVHCELIKDPKSGKSIPLHEQEAMGIKYFDNVIRHFPGLKIVFEHISSFDLCRYFINIQSENVWAGLTGHHPFIHYRQVCDGGGRVHNPHLYCKPVAKLFRDIEAVKKLMTMDHPRVIFGSDIAPHPVRSKTTKPYAAGILSFPEAVIPDLWQNVFLAQCGEGEETRKKFEDFTSPTD